MQIHLLYLCKRQANVFSVEQTTPRSRAALLLSVVAKVAIIHCADTVRGAKNTFEYSLYRTRSATGGTAITALRLGWIAVPVKPHAYFQRRFALASSLSLHILARRSTAASYLGTLETFTSFLCTLRCLVSTFARPRSRHIITYQALATLALEAPSTLLRTLRRRLSALARQRQWDIIAREALAARALEAPVSLLLALRRGRSASARPRAKDVVTFQALAAPTRDATSAFFCTCRCSEYALARQGTRRIGALETLAAPVVECAKAPERTAEGRGGRGDGEGGGTRGIKSQGKDGDRHNAINRLHLENNAACVELLEPVFEGRTGLFNALRAKVPLSNERLMLRLIVLSERGHRSQ